MSLVAYLSPQNLYNFCNRYWAATAIISFLVIAGNLFWIFSQVPIDFQQGVVAKIMYIHVPSAVLSMGLFAAMGVLGTIFLIYKIKVAPMIMRAIIPVGLLITILVLLTGSIWGKPTWGTWWIWDARLTSELILAFLYFAIYIYDQAMPNHQNTDNVLSVIAIIGSIDLPIIHYSVQWWHTLHQGPSILALKAPSIAWPMLWPLLIMIVAIGCANLALIMLRCKIIIITQEAKARWVRDLPK